MSPSLHTLSQVVHCFFYPLNTTHHRSSSLHTLSPVVHSALLPSFSRAILPHPSLSCFVGQRKGFTSLADQFKIIEISLNFRGRKTPQHNRKWLISSPKYAINFVNTLPNRISQHPNPRTTLHCHFWRDTSRSETAEGHVMYHIIYSFSSDFLSNLKMAIRAETYI